MRRYSPSFYRAQNQTVRDVVSASRAKATLVAEIDGEVQRIPVDVHRPDVIAAVLGEMPTTMDEARCDFCFTLPYALHLEVLLSIEVEHAMVPWLTVIFTHRVKRAAERD